MLLKLLRIWVILSVLWTVNSVNAEDTVVFIDPNEVYNTIQKLHECEELSLLNEQKFSELNQVVDNQKIQIDNCDNRVKELENIIEDTDELKLKQDVVIDSLQQLLKTQKEEYKKIIQDSKPSFFEKMLNGLSYLGVGILIGVLL